MLTDFSENSQLLMIMLLVVMPCAIIGRYRGFGEIYCLQNVGIYTQVHTVLQQNTIVSFHEKLKFPILNFMEVEQFLSCFMHTDG